MARPRVPAYEGEEARDKWERLLRYEEEHGLSANEMAALLGFVSGGAYRGAKTRKRLPKKAWARFLQRQGALDEKALVELVLTYEGAVYLDGRVTLVDEPMDLRTCECGCGKTWLVSKRSRSKRKFYATRCRVRMHRRRHG